MIYIYIYYKIRLITWGTLLTALLKNLLLLKVSQTLTQMSTVWQDPDFDSTQQAFYYVRAIEIPIPRWTCYNQKRFGIKMDPEVPMTTPERVYISPKWFIP